MYEYCLSTGTGYCQQVHQRESSLKSAFLRPTFFPNELSAMFMLTLLGLICILFLSGCKVDFNAFDDSVTQSDDGTHFVWSSGFSRLEVEARGVITFSDDDSEIVDLSGEGVFTLSEVEGPLSRQIQFRKDAAGKIHRSYSENGEDLPFQQETGQWLRDLLPQVIRKTGFDGARRARTILARSGPEALLEEIRLLENASIKRIYLQELLQSPLEKRHRDEAVEEVSKVNSTTPFIQSYQALAGIDPDDERFTEDLIDLASRGTRATTRRRVLVSLPGLRPFTEGNWVSLIESAGGIYFGSERAEALVEILGLAPLQGPTARAFMKATSSIRSSTQKSRVLQEVIKKGNLDSDMSSLVTDATRSIHSSPIRAEVLSRLATELPEDERALEEFLVSVAALPESGLKEPVLRSYLQEPRSPGQLAALLGFVQEELQQGEVRRQLEQDLGQKIEAGT